MKLQGCELLTTLCSILFIWYEIFRNTFNFLTKTFNAIDKKQNKSYVFLQNIDNSTSRLVNKTKDLNQT